MNLTMLKRYLQIFKKKLKILKKNISKANFPLSFINSAAVQYNNKTYNNNERNKEDEIIISPQFLVNQPMSVKQNRMWRLDNRDTIILVGRLNNQNIYIRILTICLPGQLFALYQKLREQEKTLKRFI